MTVKQIAKAAMEAMSASCVIINEYFNSASVVISDGACVVVIHTVLGSPVYGYISGQATEEEVASRITTEFQKHGINPNNIVWLRLSAPMEEGHVTAFKVGA